MRVDAALAVWSFEPYQLVPIGIAAALYAWRVRTLGRGGRRPPTRKLACFAAGLLLLLAAVVTPIGAIAEERLFWMHMCQHVLIGDVAPFLVALGLNGSLVRPVAALRSLRAFRIAAHPVVALSVWAADLVLWHVPALYDAALAHPALHALQHLLFFACGALVWSVLLGIVPGPQWFGTARRAAYLAAMWFVSLGLSSFFLWYHRPLYARYVDAPRTWGFSPLGDQQLGGGVMLLEGSFVMLGVLVWLALRWFAETESRQRLLDSNARASGV